ncbi:MAG: YitT family protein [Bacilli bacterium]|nr:YitT family protein [Bacilli bacterium]MDD3068621.1 YitT family protein [Bacilli bacterium]HKM10125.1 YitT family protein [Bacilli bacterium]
MNKIISKINLKNYALQIFVVVIGSFLLAFGNVVFLSPAMINAGGLNGISIIVQSFFKDSDKVLVYNITTASLSIILWIIGLIFIGKDFAIKTLLSTIMVPIATAFLSFMPYVSEWCINISTAILSNVEDVGSILLAAITGGVIVGAGVSITFVGGGSSGGVDVINFVMNKYLNIKQSVGSFLIDGIIVFVGLVILLPQDSTFLVQCLCGILSAFITAILIEYVYIGAQTSYKVEIISSKWKEISAYVQDVLGRGATIIHAQGGYKGDERVILSVVFDKSQYIRIRDFIVKTDPNAFITFTQTNAVYGEGFKKIFSKKKTKKE